MDYSFNGEIAALYGIDEAVFIHNLYWWIRKNEANGRHYYDGRSWTYNSMEAFTKLFPFWTIKQVRRIIAKLRDDGAIHIGNYNSRFGDRTQWYSLSDDVLNFYPKGQITSAQTGANKCPNGHTTSAQMGAALPDSKPDSNTDNNTPLPPRGKNKSEKSFFTCQKILDNSDLSAEEKLKLGQWLQHKRERKEKCMETGFRALLTEYQNNVGQFGRDAVFKAIDQSMAGGYVGIAWDKLNQTKGNSGKSPPKNRASSFDIDEIEASLSRSPPGVL